LRTTGGNEWQVGKGQRQCCVCGTPFGENQTFYSALSDEDGELDREDFCPACWEGRRQESFFSFWKTRLVGLPRRPRVDVGVLLDVFWHLQERQEPREKAFRFVLGLYLWRRKALSLVGSERRGDAEVLLFQADGRQALPVENPHLDAESIEQVTHELKQLLQMDL